MLEVLTSSNISGSENFGAEEMQFIELGSGKWRVTIRTPQWRPPTDVYETDDEIIVRVEIAGMREEDFSIQLENRTLSIRGIRPDNTSRRAYHQMEIRFGEFGIMLELPVIIAVENVKAVYDNGFLIVTLPKMQPRTIQINEQN